MGPAALADWMVGCLASRPKTTLAEGGLAQGLHSKANQSLLCLLCLRPNYITNSLSRYTVLVGRPWTTSDSSLLRNILFSLLTLCLSMKNKGLKESCGL